MFQFYSAHPPEALSQLMYSEFPRAGGWPFFDSSGTIYNPGDDEYHFPIGMVLSPSMANRRGRRPDSYPMWVSSHPLPGQVQRRHEINADEGFYLQPFMTPPITYQEAMAWMYRLEGVDTELTLGITEELPKIITSDDGIEYDNKDGPAYMWPRDVQFTDRFHMKAGITYAAGDLGGISDLNAEVDRRRETGYGNVGGEDAHEYFETNNWHLEGFHYRNTRTPTHRFMQGTPPEYYLRSVNGYDLTLLSDEWDEELSHPDVQTKKRLPDYRILAGMDSYYLNFRYWPINDDGWYYDKRVALDEFDDPIRDDYGEYIYEDYIAYQKSKRDSRSDKCRLAFTIEGGLGSCLGFGNTLDSIENEIYSYFSSNQYLTGSTRIAADTPANRELIVSAYDSGEINIELLPATITIGPWTMNAIHLHENQPYVKGGAIRNRSTSSTCNINIQPSSWYKPKFVT